MSNRRKLLWFLVFVTAVLLIDQAGKYLATQYLSDGLRRAYLGEGE